MGGPGRIAPLEGFQNSRPCLHYQGEESQGGNLWSQAQGASAGSCLHGLGLIAEQSRAGYIDTTLHLALRVF